MNWGIWDRLEDVMLEAEVRPIVAVIPDNTDPKLFIDPPNGMFWDRVRSWQSRGWTIGMHGCHHRYVNDHRGMIGSATGSEFAGLPFDQQDSKIEKALGIFAREGVTADAWIAPNHSFDRTTLSVLRHRGPNVVIDGFSLFPDRDADGIIWVPQQLWDLRRRMFGVWTVCLHHNRWETERLDAFVRDLHVFRRKVTDLSSVLSEYGTRRRNRLDRAFGRWARRGGTKPEEAHGHAIVRWHGAISGSIEGRR
jgi:predicted deacetylase